MALSDCSHPLSAKMWVKVSKGRSVSVVVRLSCLHTLLATRPPVPTCLARLACLFPATTICPPASRCLQLFNWGVADGTNAWAVTDITSGFYNFNLSTQVYGKYSKGFSQPGDPMPLKPAPNSSMPDAYAGVTDQRFMIFMTGARDGAVPPPPTPPPPPTHTRTPHTPPPHTHMLLPPSPAVERFWWPSVLNRVLPVVMVALLAMVIFFLDTSELNDRLQSELSSLQYLWYSPKTEAACCLLKSTAFLPARLHAFVTNLAEFSFPHTLLQSLSLCFLR